MAREERFLTKSSLVQLEFSCDPKETPCVALAEHGEDVINFIFILKLVVRGEFLWIGSRGLLLLQLRRNQVYLQF